MNMDSEVRLKCMGALARYVPFGACEVLDEVSPAILGFKSWDNTRDGCAIIRGCVSCILAHTSGSSSDLPESAWQHAKEVVMDWKIRRGADPVLVRHMGHAFASFSLLGGTKSEKELALQVLPYRDVRVLLARWVWATRYEDCWVLE